MKGLIARFRMDRYVSSYLILFLDLLFSTLSSAGSALLSGLLVGSSGLPPRIYVVWLAGAAIASGIFFCLFRPYRAVIRHATLREVERLVLAVLGKELLLGIAWGMGVLKDFSELQFGMLLLLDFLLTLSILILMRVAMVAGYDLIRKSRGEEGRRRRVLIYGTADKSVALVKRLQHSPHYRIVGFLTYGSGERNRMLAECRVHRFEQAADLRGLRDSLAIDCLLFATEGEAQAEQERLIRYGTDCGLKILIAPPIDEVVAGKVMKQSVREIKIEDLLGRPQVEISQERIAAEFRGKTVMVTGAAGSIGSELCRQLGALPVKKLVLFDNAETPMDELRLELEERYPNLEFATLIGDIRLERRLDFAFRSYRPEVVFHAAAYKHVSLMEENPCEAVLVNVVGSRNIADKCLEYDVAKMVLVSTDKAVNPTNVMGCSKRLAEIYVQALGQAVEQGRIKGRTEFVTLRFGNVLGSIGSAIPRFREQIAEGGPVTVTHPDITRYFMTASEASRLILEATSMSSGNQIFVFDMGSAVRIADLVRRMIVLAGFEPDKEIKIEYTGLRSGEKLCEDTLAAAENTEPTRHARIRIVHGREYDCDQAREMADRLESLSRAVNVPDMIRFMKRSVPEFISRNSQYGIFDGEY